MSSLDSSFLLLEESSNARICESFIQGGCSASHVCEFVHHKVPYVWQILNETVWQNLSSHESQNIEQAFCNPYADEASVNLFVLSPSDILLQLHAIVNFTHMQIAVQGNETWTTTSIRRLSTPSYVKTESCVATQWRWFWLQGTEWKEFGMEKTPLQSVLESKYLHNQLIYRYEITSTPKEAAVNTFFIDLQSFTMKNMAGNKWQLRRRPIFISESDILMKKFLERPPPADLPIPFSRPSDWTPVDPLQEVELIPMHPDSVPFHLVASEFHKTLREGRTICDIFKIQNLFLWSKFFGKKQSMLKKSSVVKELQLFHGTSDPYTVHAIFRQNFDPRVCGKNATIYGKGSYFALKASLSDKYCRTGSQQDVKWMFLVRCLVGRYTKGKKDYTRPPPINPSVPSGDLYDSCVDDLNKPTIYVLFDSDQYYPEYAISYRLDENAVAPM